MSVIPYWHLRKGVEYWASSKENDEVYYLGVYKGRSEIDGMPLLFSRKGEGVRKVAISEYGGFYDSKPVRATLSSCSSEMRQMERIVRLGTEFLAEIKK